MDCCDRKEADECRGKKTWWKKFGDPLVVMTGILSLVTGLLAIVSILQWRTLEKTDETFWAQQRPWIGPPKTIAVKSFELSRIGPSITAKLEYTLPIQNFGNMPAVELAPLVRIGSPDFGTVSPETFGRKCELSTVRGGAAIFPKDKIDLYGRVELSGIPATASVHRFLLHGCIRYKFAGRSGLTPFEGMLTIIEGRPFQFPSADAATAIVPLESLRIEILPNLDFSAE
jgi:hypothetical protein